MVGAKSFTEMFTKLFFEKENSWCKEVVRLNQIVSCTWNFQINLSIINVASDISKLDTDVRFTIVLFFNTFLDIKSTTWFLQQKQILVPHCSFCNITVNLASIRRLNDESYGQHVDKNTVHFIFTIFLICTLIFTTLSVV